MRPFVFLGASSTRLVRSFVRFLNLRYQLCPWSAPLCIFAVSFAGLAVLYLHVATLFVFLGPRWRVWCTQRVWCTHARTHTRTRARTRSHTHTRTCLRTHPFIHLHTCSCSWSHAYTSAHTRTHARIHAHTRAGTHAHTRACTCTRARMCAYTRAHAPRVHSRVPTSTNTHPYS